MKMKAASSLIEKVEQVIWDEGQEEDAFVSVHALVIEEMRYRIYPGIVWDFQKWARSKAEEHTVAKNRIETILLKVKENNDVPNDADDFPVCFLSVKKLRDHHERIANRYKRAAMACND